MGTLTHTHTHLCTLYELAGFLSSQHLLLIPPLCPVSLVPKGFGVGTSPLFPSPLLVYGPGHRATGPAHGATATDNKTSLVSSESWLFSWPVGKDHRDPLKRILPLPTQELCRKQGSPQKPLCAHPGYTQPGPLALPKHQPDADTKTLLSSEGGGAAPHGGTAVREAWRHPGGLISGR